MGHNLIKAFLILLALQPLVLAVIFVLLVLKIDSRLPHLKNNADKTFITVQELTTSIINETCSYPGYQTLSKRIDQFSIKESLVP